MKTKKDDVKKEVLEKEAAVKPASANSSDEFPELEAVEASIAAEEVADSLEAPKGAEESEDKEEVVKEDSKEVKIKEKVEDQKDEDENVDDGLTDDVRDVLSDVQEARPTKNIEAEAKRKAEQAAENESKPETKAPMSDEELEELVARDYPGMSIEQFKANWKFNADYYANIAAPDIKRSLAQEKKAEGFHTEIQKFKHYGVLKTTIDDLLENDAAIKLLPPEYKYMHAYKLAVSQELPKVLGRRVKKASMQAEDKRRLIPSHSAASNPTKAKKSLIALTDDIKEAMKNEGLTEEDINNPNLYGRTIIEDD